MSTLVDDLAALAEELRIPPKHMPCDSGLLIAARENIWRGRSKAADRIEELIERHTQ